MARRSRNEIFVGNIEYNVTEELLVSTFSEVGRVVDIRMKMELAGRPAGFGFVEFDDAETARSAIALFDGRLLKGRPLKVSWPSESPFANETVPVVPSAQALAVQYAVQGFFGIDPQGGSSEACIRMLGDLKQMVEHSPRELRDLLTNHPSFALAVLNMEIMSGLMGRPLPLQQQQQLQLPSKKLQKRLPQSQDQIGHYGPAGGPLNQQPQQRLSEFTSTPIPQQPPPQHYQSAYASHQDVPPRLSPPPGVTSGQSMQPQHPQNAAALAAAAMTAALLPQSIAQPAPVSSSVPAIAKPPSSSATSSAPSRTKATDPRDPRSRKRGR